jgi:LPS export ABC transporter permease LptF/LPS export ABC transporter permease LptG
MTRIQRYVFRELLGPTFVGLLAYGVVLLMNLSMHAAEMMIRRDLSITLVLQFVALAIPRILVLTLPMAVLVGILVGVGRLISDNELGALRALGYNDRRLTFAALSLGILASAATWVIYDTAVPAANYAQHQLQARIFISSDLNREIQARTFFEKIPGLLIYADETNPADGTLRRVLIHQKGDGGHEEISTAGRARIEYRATDGILNFRLEDVVSHSWDRSDPHIYQVAQREEETLVRPPDIFTTEMLRTLEDPPPPNLREQSVAQLVETIRGFDEMRPGIVKRRFINEAWVELHKKFALPATCFAFAFLALPLGLAQRRGGRAWGFLISLLVVAIQYFLLTSGEQMADRGRMPAWLAMWLGNLIFLAIGALLLVLGGRWSMDPQPLLDRLRFRRGQGEVAPPPEPDLEHHHEVALPSDSRPGGRGKTHPPVPRFTPPELPFWRRRLLPAVDRYLLRTLIGVGLLVVNVLPQFITHYVLPMVLCSATLISFALLARHHELTALRSAGIGPLRVSWVFLAAGSVAAALSLVALDSVLPATNQKAIELRDRIRGRSPRSYRQPERRWVFGSRGDLVTFTSLSAERKEILDLALLRFRPGDLMIRQRIFAQRAAWKEGEGWELTDGWSREFDGTGETYEEFDSRLVQEMDGPEYFTQEWKAPDQMNIRELRAHVSDLKHRGYETREIQVGLHRKIAVPAVCLVMVLIALPFGLRIEKRGPLFGLGVALLIAAGYYFLMQASGKLGEVGLLPPLLAAWVPNVIFSGAGLYLMASSRW